MNPPLERGSIALRHLHDPGLERLAQAPTLLHPFVWSGAGFSSFWSWI